MIKRFKEPSTWAGIGVAGLTAYQQTNNWWFAIVAALGAMGAIIQPESGNK